MNDWLNGAGQIGDAAAVLVTVAMVEGSGPREPGAKMLVTARRQFDTIGGGHLEQRAVDIARAMLAGAARPGQGGRGGDIDARDGANPARLQRFALGPTLGQCCGGVVHLAFEPVTPALRAVLQGLLGRRREDSWRVTAIDGGHDALLFDAAGRQLAGAALPAAPPAPPSLPLPMRLSAYLWQDQAGRRWLIDPCLAPRAHLVLFGAGHVGAAIVRALAELPCGVTWVDQREDMFPAAVPANVTVEASDIPEALVAAAPAGASFLVMTHSHALDQRLAEAIMARPEFGWFGLIGSKTKRKQFEHRLQARGVAAERLAAMTCPIGLAGISNKAPAVIAASVCAQLLGVWEAQQAASAAPPLRLVGARPSAARR